MRMLRIVHDSVYDSCFQIVYKTDDNLCGSWLFMSYLQEKYLIKHKCPSDVGT